MFPYHLRPPAYGGKLNTKKKTKKKITTTKNNNNNNTKRKRDLITTNDDDDDDNNNKNDHLTKVNANEHEQQQCTKNDNVDDNINVNTNSNTNSKDDDDENNNNINLDPYCDGGPVQRAIVQDFIRLQKQFTNLINEITNTWEEEVEEELKKVKRISKTGKYNNHNQNLLPNNNQHIECGVIFQDAFKVVFGSNHVALLHRSTTIMNTFRSQESKKRSKLSTATRKNRKTSNEIDDDDEEENDDDNNDDNSNRELSSTSSDDDCDNDTNDPVRKVKKKKIGKNSTVGSTINDDNKDNELTLCHLQPSNRIHVPSYTQLLYASCLFLLQKQQLKQQNTQTVDTEILSPQHAFPIFCLYALYETNPLPAPPSSLSEHKDSSTCDNSGTPVKSILRNQKKKKRTKHSQHHDNDDDVNAATKLDYDLIVSLLPMGLVNRENPKAMFRRYGPYRPSIRIDPVQYLYLLHIRDLALVTQSKCNQKQYHTNLSNNNDIDVHCKQSTTTKRCFCAVATDVLYIINIMLSKQHTMFEFCSYSGPCSLEGLAGHSDYRKIYSNSTPTNTNRTNRIRKKLNTTIVNATGQNTDTPNVPKPLDNVLPEPHTEVSPLVDLPDMQQNLQNYINHRNQIRNILKNHGVTNSSNGQDTMKKVGKLVKVYQVLSPLLAQGNDIDDTPTTLRQHQRSVWSNLQKRSQTINDVADEDALDLVNEIIIKNKSNDREWLLGVKDRQQQKRLKTVLDNEQENHPNKSLTTTSRRRRLRVSFGNTVVVNDTVTNNAEQVSLNTVDDDTSLLNLQMTTTAGTDQGSSQPKDDQEIGLTYDLRLPESISDIQAECLQNVVRTIFNRHPNMLDLDRHKKQGVPRNDLLVTDEGSLMGVSVVGFDQLDTVSVLNHEDDIETDEKVEIMSNDTRKTTATSVSGIGRGALASLLKQAMSRPSIEYSPDDSPNREIPRKSVHERGHFFLDSSFDVDGTDTQGLLKGDDVNSHKKMKTKINYMSDLSDEGSSEEDDDDDEMSMAVSQVGRSALNNLLSQASKTNPGDGVVKSHRRRRKVSKLKTHASHGDDDDDDDNEDGNSVALSQVGNAALTNLLALAKVRVRANPLGMQRTRNGDTEDGNTVASSQVGHAALTNLLALANAGSRSDSLGKASTGNSDDDDGRSVALSQVGHAALTNLLALANAGARSDQRRVPSGDYGGDDDGNSVASSQVGNAALSNLLTRSYQLGLPSAASGDGCWNGSIL